VPPAWVPAAIVAEGRKARENLRGESSWEFFASGGPYILGINSLWPRVIEEVQALALEPSNETALARACYAQIFGVFSED